MLTYARWKYVVLVLAILFSTIYALPNLYQKDPSVQVTANRGAPIDQALVTRVSESLTQAGIATKQVAIDGDNLLVRLTGTEDQSKAAAALAPVLGNDYVTALNLASTVPSWLDRIGASGMLLGLDLQGGVHFLMQVDQKAAIDKHLDAVVEDVRVVLRDSRVRYESVTRRPDNSIAVRLLVAADADAARKKILVSQPGVTQTYDEAVGITYAAPCATASTRWAWPNH